MRFPYGYSGGVKRETRSFSKSCARKAVMPLFVQKYHSIYSSQTKSFLPNKVASAKKGRLSVFGFHQRSSPLYRKGGGGDVLESIEP